MQMARSDPTTTARLADSIVRRLTEEEAHLKQYWNDSQPVKHCFLDDVFPKDVAVKLREVFPDPGSLRLMKNLREQKRVGNRLEAYHPLVGEALTAFQDPRVLALVSRITGIQDLVADSSFYASGVSHMAKGDFLNPHLDNSHDGDGRLYRVLNALYYANPGWEVESGGNLELWEKGLRNGHTVVSSFNRLVLMATDRQSWHSVSQLQVDGPRLCYSNYYFTQVHPDEKPFMHVTTFAGRPEEKVKGMVLRVDGIARNAVKRLFPKAGLVKAKEADRDS